MSVENKEKFELENILIKTDFKDNYLQVMNYEILQNGLTDFLSTKCFKDLVIQNEFDLKLVKEKRADLNKLYDRLQTTRKNTTKAITGVYVSQVMALEKQIKQVTDTLSQNVKDYIGSKEDEFTQPKVYTLTIHSLDKKVLKEIEKLAKEKNLKTELKESK